MLLFYSKSNIYFYLKSIKTTYGSCSPVVVLFIPLVVAVTISWDTVTVSAVLQADVITYIIYIHKEIKF